MTAFLGMSLAGCGGGNQATQEEQTVIRVAALKGPTAMGMVKLMEDAQAGESTNQYEFTLAGTADEVTPKIVQGELDIAAVPANLASVLYNKTEGNVQMLAVNTLGVIYLVEKGDSVNSFADLKGKTIYMTAKGSVPEYATRYILEENGLKVGEDVTIEWKSEAAEIVALMNATDENVIAVLPQPYATVAQSKVADLRVIKDMNEAWNELDNGNKFLTGVLIVRKEFAEKYPQQLAAFVSEYQASTDYANTNVAEAALLVEKVGIVQAPIAEKALPKCNIICLTGDEMKAAAAGFLQILFDQNPQALGGAMPADDFYYGAK